MHKEETHNMQGFTVTSWQQQTRVAIEGGKDLSFVTENPRHQVVKCNQLTTVIHLPKVTDDYWQLLLGGWWLVGSFCAVMFWC